MSARRGSFLAITRALFAMETRQHAPFFVPYLAFGAALSLLSLLSRFHAVGVVFLLLGFMALCMVPLFLGGQVFGAEMAEGTERFAASLPVRPGHRWTVKAAFGLPAAAALMGFVSLGLWAAFSAASAGQPMNDQGLPTDLRTLLLFHFLWPLVGFSCAAFCTLVLRRPLPAVILSAFQAVGFLVFASFFSSLYPERSSLLVDLMIFLSLCLLGAGFLLFTRGRGHLGIASDRLFYGLAGLGLPPAVVVGWLLSRAL